MVAPAAAKARLHRAVLERAAGIEGASTHFSACPNPYGSGKNPGRAAIWKFTVPEMERTCCEALKARNCAAKPLRLLSAAPNCGANRHPIPGAGFRLFRHDDDEGRTVMV